MASGGGDEGGSSWWGSLVKTAKEKSKNALELIKTDLAEFTSTMTNDTNYLLSQATAQLKEISTQHLDEDNRREGNLKSSSNSEEKLRLSTIHDRFKNELEHLQSSQSTYLNDPDQAQPASNSEFKDWKSTFTSESYKSEISELLIQNGAMRLLYSQLVPAQLTNEEFWSRYFYKVNLLQEENKKRVKLLERAGNQENNEQEEFDWEDEDEHSKEKKVETKSEDLKTEQVTCPTNSTPNLTTMPSESQAEKENTNEQSGSDLDLTLNENENLAKSDSSDVIIENDLNDSKKLLNPQIETEPTQKTEESDEWERVSDVGSEKKERHSDSASETSDTGTISNIDNGKKKESENKGKINKSKGSSKRSEQKKGKEQEKSNDEWDNWDE